MSIEERHVHIQSWDKSPPSRKDVLVVLARTLDLLREALPVALRHIGAESPSTQSDFWFSFHYLDRISDFTELADLIERNHPEGDSWEMKISGAMEELNELAAGHMAGE